MPTDARKKNFRPIAILGLLAGVVVVTAGLVYWSVESGTAAKARKLVNPIPPSPSDIAAGLQIYRSHCQKCHGKDGDGKGEKAAELSASPHDFTDAHEMRTWKDGELFWVITNGHRPMPAFRDKLTDEERWQAVDYIRTFAEKPSGATALPAPADAPLQK